MSPARAGELDGLEATTLWMANAAQRFFSTSMSDTDSRCYLVFTRCLSRWKRSVSVSLYPWWCLRLESNIISGALRAQSSSAYSCSTDEGWIPRNTVYWGGSGAFVAGLQSGRFDGLLVCSGRQSWVSEVRSQVGRKTARSHDVVSNPLFPYYRRSLPSGRFDGPLVCSGRLIFHGSRTEHY